MEKTHLDLIWTMSLYQIHRKKIWTQGTHITVTLLPASSCCFLGLTFDHPQTQWQFTIIKKEVDWIPPQISSRRTGSPTKYWRFLWFWLTPYIWVFPKSGYPKMDEFIRENPIRIDDLGVPQFWEAPIYLHIGNHFQHQGWDPDRRRTCWCCDWWCRSWDWRCNFFTSQDGLSSLIRWKWWILLGHQSIILILEYLYIYINIYIYFWGISSMVILW